MCSALRSGELAANDARERSNSTLMVGPVDFWPDSNCRCIRGFQVAGNAREFTHAGPQTTAPSGRTSADGEPRCALQTGTPTARVRLPGSSAAQYIPVPQDGEHVVQVAGTSVSSLSVAHITALEPVAFPTVSPTIRTPDHTAMQV